MRASLLKVTKPLIFLPSKLALIKQPKKHNVMTTSEAFFSLFCHFAFYLESATKLVRAFALKGLSDSCRVQKEKMKLSLPHPVHTIHQGRGVDCFCPRKLPHCLYDFVADCVLLISGGIPPTISNSCHILWHV